MGPKRPQMGRWKNAVPDTHNIKNQMTSARGMVTNKNMHYLLHETFNFL